MPRTKKIRMKISIEPEQYRRLRELTSRVRAKTVSETFARALHLLDVCSEAVARGCDIYIHEPDSCANPTRIDLLMGDDDEA